MRAIIFMAFFFVGLMVSAGILTQGHEEAHQAIGDNYGCVNGTISNYVVFGYWKCLERGEVTQEQVQSEKFLHTVNEIVGYNLSVFFFAITLIITILFLLLSPNLEGKE